MGGFLNNIPGIAINMGKKYLTGLVTSRMKPIELVWGDNVGRFLLAELFGIGYTFSKLYWESAHPIGILLANGFRYLPDGCVGCSLPRVQM